MAVQSKSCCDWPTTLSPGLLHRNNPMLLRHGEVCGRMWYCSVRVNCGSLRYVMGLSRSHCAGDRLGVTRPPTNHHVRQFPTTYIVVMTLAQTLGCEPP